MGRLAIPITVRCGHDAIDLDLQAAAPLPWRVVEPAVLRAAGLAEGTTLFLGAGPAEPEWLVGSPPLVAGCLLATEPQDDLPEDPLVQLVVVAGPDAGLAVPVTRSPLTVGRDPRVDLTLSDPQISYRHALLRPTSTGLDVTDLGSTNGVLVDGVPARRATPAGTGALIRMGGTLVQVQLSVRSTGSFTPDGAGHLVRAGSADSPAETLPAVPPHPGRAPQRHRRPLPLVSAVLGAAVGGTLAIVLGSPMYLAFAALGPVTMLGTAISDRWSGRRSYRKELADYRDALAGHHAGVRAASQADRRLAWRAWPDPATLLRRARAGDSRLWSRPRGDPAFLELSIGTGSRPVRVVGAGADGAVTEPREAAADPPALVRDVPITIPARGVLGLAGDDGRHLARWLLVQVACHHSPADLAMLLVGARTDLRTCRTLPHIPGPLPAATSRAPDEGPAVIGDAAAVHDRHLVAVLDGASAIRSPAGRALMAAARSAQPGDAEAPRVSVICLADRTATLPTGCTRLDEAGRLAATGCRCDVTGVHADLLEQVSRALTPLRDAGAPGIAPPGPLRLSDLLGPLDPEAMRRRWARPRPLATVGAGPAGPLTIDLDADGPHLLIAGTTGSGKSELLRTLIAALAVASPPQRMTFLLVDYKGGAALRTVAGLPHVVGVLTDLDPTLSARALASLRAELRRREALESTGGPTPPRLVLVIDEFATLAAELPDFLSGVLDIAQRGRSLGLHLVLATQRPAGVVSPAMRANISARICLRVTDPADSIDVIGTPDAVQLDVHAPGSAILRTGSGLTAFRTALATAPPPPRLEVRRVDDAATVTIAPDAPSATEMVPDAPGSGPPVGTAVRLTEEALVVRAARQAAGDDPAPARPWLPPLPERFVPRQGRTQVIALADLPDEQRRQDLTLPDGSILVTGPAGSGRSTALRRLAMAAATRASELLVVDAAGALADLRRWPQVSSYLTLDEPRLVLRLLELLAGAHRRSASRLPRYLIIDGYDLVAAALDRTDYATGAATLTDLPARTAGAVRMIAGGPPALRHGRVATNFPHLVDLRADPGDQPPGRGRWSGTLVQFADAPPDQQPPPPPTDAGTAPPAPRLVIRPLPALVEARHLPEPVPQAVPLGLGGDAADPVTVDLRTTGGAIVVSGARGCGVSTALSTVASGAARCGIPVLRIVRGIGADDGDDGDGDTASWSGTRTLTVREDPGQVRSVLAAHSGPLLLVVDQCGDGDDHPAADLLERFCRVAGPGQSLLLGERPDLLARAHRGHLRAALSFRRGLLLAPDTADGALLDAVVPRRTGAPPPGRGVWVQAGVTTPVQVASM